MARLKELEDEKRRLKKMPTEETNSFETVKLLMDADVHVTRKK